MSDPAAKFATPRVAAGAMFVDGDRVLMVRKTYGNRWDIPGGYVDAGESPAAACEREVREEWVPVERLAGYAIPRLARRLASAYEASANTVGTVYLEHGEPTLARR